MEKITKKERKELKKFERELEKEEAVRKNYYKKAVYWVIGFAVVALLAWLIFGALTAKPNTNPGTPSVPPISSTDIATGSATAKANLIEYADFDCPACATHSKYVEQLRTEFSNDLRVAYRFFPLVQHRWAMLSAQSAYAAHKQDKFWEMNKLLFENQATWSNADNAEQIFDGYAQQLDLNMDKFNEDQTSEETIDYIQKQYLAGLEDGITYTPSFFLNGRLIQPANYEEFKALVENEIKKK